MAAVYGRAALVLGAAKATSTMHGFLNRREPFNESTLVVKSKEYVESDDLAVHYRFYPDHDTYEEPLDKRGWALQERLSAKRYLAYGRKEISWRCLESRWCENEHCLLFDKSPLPNFDEVLHATNPGGSGDVWRESALLPYGKRDLTFHDDKLVALSALAFQFATRFQAKYYAGLWQDDIICGLAWEAHSAQVELLQAGNFSSPSWSWASVGKFIPYTGPSSNCTPLVEIIEIHTKPLTSDPFGPVREGLLRLRGIAARVTAQAFAVTNYHKEMRLYYDEINSSNFSDSWRSLDTLLVVEPIRLEDGTIISTARRATRTDGKKAQSSLLNAGQITLWVCPLFYSTEDGFPAIRALVLAPSFTRPGHYERIGFINHSALGGSGTREPPQSKMKDFLSRWKPEVISVV